jgi:hypothetical protein
VSREPVFLVAYGLIIVSVRSIHMIGWKLWGTHNVDAGS